MHRLPRIAGLATTLPTSASLPRRVRPHAMLDASRRLVLWICLGFMTATALHAQSPTEWRQMNYGPFFSGMFNTPLPRLENPTYKGIAIQLGSAKDGAALFDTDLLRFSAWWSGGFITLAEGRDGLGEGVSARPDGRVELATGNRPGWSTGSEFTDPRPQPWGPLPRTQAKYRGLYRGGQHVVLSYTVGEANVLDSPGLEMNDRFQVFTRTIELASAHGALTVLLCENPVATNVLVNGGGAALLEEAGMLTAVALAPPAGEASLAGAEHQVRLQVGPQTRHVKVLLWHGSKSDLPRFLELARHSRRAEPLEPLTHGGPRQWDQPVVTVGVRGTHSGAYVIDTITPPYDNPWKSYLRFSGHDFFSNGDAAICSISGDVWIVKGIDARLDKLRWTRHATGLFEPLGLKIVNDRLYVLGRDQITRLHDLNQDGEADFYENFNNDAQVLGHGHGFHAELHTDREGNFYYCVCADNDNKVAEHGGCVVKVSADGTRLERVGTGFRNPNGMTVGTNDMIIVGDQQGNWVPSSRLDWVRPGGFYGYLPMHHRAKPPATYDPPLMWIPHSADNSCGGQAWVESDRWGPVGGRLVHLSYGACRVFIVFPQRVGQEIQAAAVALPLRFSTGIMRARFSPHDGQLYVSGLRGWQTAGPLSGGFYRVRYTGQPLRLPVDFQIRPDGAALTFSDPINRASAIDPGSYHVEQWNYLWSAQYGSLDYSVSNPTRKGRDPVTVKSASLSADGRTITLVLDPIRPVMQMRVQYHLEAADGTPLQNEVFSTINVVPK